MLGRNTSREEPNKISSFNYDIRVPGLPGRRNCHGAFILNRVENVEDRNNMQD